MVAASSYGLSDGHVRRVAASDGRLEQLPTTRRARMAQGDFDGAPEPGAQRARPAGWAGLCRLMECGWPEVQGRGGAGREVGLHGARMSSDLLDSKVEDNVEAGVGLCSEVQQICRRGLR